MVATVVIHCWSGDPLMDSGAIAGGADLSSADNCGYDSANRIANPLNPSTFSFEKWLRAHVTVNPDNWIGNFRVWSDGGMPVNSILRVGSSSSELAPTRNPSVIAVNDFALMTAAAKGVWDLTIRDLADLAIDPYTNFLVFQLFIQSAFAPGDWGPEIVYFEYQEA